MKRFTDKKAADVVNKILGTSQRHFTDYRRLILGNLIKNVDGSGIVACDGVRTVKLFKRPSADIAALWTTKKPTRAFFDEQDRIRGRIFDEFSKWRESGLVEIAIPDLKTAPMEYDGKSRYYYVTEYGQAYNKSYLADMQKLFPSARWYVAPEKKYSALYVIAEQGEAFLMPVMLDIALMRRHAA